MASLAQITRRRGCAQKGLRFITTQTHPNQLQPSPVMIVSVWTATNKEIKHLHGHKEQ